MKTALKIAGVLLTVVATGIIVVLLIIYYFFFSTANLPTGKLMGEVISPTGEYTVKTYLTNGGATTAYAVRGEVVKHKKWDKKKNIYWQYKEEQTEIRWVDEHTVSLNGVELDVRKDVYDWRKVK